MTAGPSRWRRCAVRLARHSAWVLPGAGSPWADAMRHELAYIEDDPTALRWALGCVVASYSARLTRWWRFALGPAWRQVAMCGALMLVIGLALQDRAGGQTEPPRPAFRTTCDLPHVTLETRAELRCDPCGAKIAPHVADQPASDTSCAERTSHGTDRRIH